MEATDAPRPSGEGSLHDIRGILKEYLAPIPQRTNFFGDELKGFFNNSDVPPDSTFGKFVRLEAVEKKMQKGFEDYARPWLARKQEPSRTAKVEMEERRTALNTVRDVRKILGKQIFGENVDEYTKRVEDALFGFSGRTRREKRLAAQEELIQDVKTKFPLTSK